MLAESEECRRASLKHEMAKWRNCTTGKSHCGIRVSVRVNPNNYWELTTAKSVIFRLTWALFSLTVVPFRHFAISCFTTRPSFDVSNQINNFSFSECEGDLELKIIKETKTKNLGSRGFEFRPGLSRCFLCPTLVTCWIFHLSRKQSRCFLVFRISSRLNCN
jgi:hypothetical protein